MNEAKRSSLFRTPSFKAALSCLIFVAAIIFSACDKDDDDVKKDPESIVPERFAIDIPSSISSQDSKTKSSKVDTLRGEDLYQHLRNFIGAGEASAKLIQDVLLWVALHNLTHPMEFTFISDDDGRAKHLSVVENVKFDGKNWQYCLTVKDIENGMTKDTNIGLQIFYDLDPIVGTAILNFYNIDRNHDKVFKDTYYKVEYSEKGNLGYEKHMIVSIADFPIPPQEPNIYALTNMKMFVGKTGDIISIYGNSKHPNAFFFDDKETGFNWAFVAAAHDKKNIAVAEVGLPPMNLDADDRYTLLEEYSMENVLKNQILSVWPTIDTEILNAYLYETKAPAFFNNGGFVQGQTAPTDDYLPLEGKIQDLVPYNPKKDILNLLIEFYE